ncbi:DNA polymerase III subunit epsilon [Methylophilaceae bacterium]|nr:DNA polymerase III subunit epsilon [Methylophilaceae bacterium]
MRQIFLDTETTGLDPNQGHRVIEIAAIEFNNRQATSNRFHFYVNPQREIDAAAQEVHGITLDFLNDKPLFVDIAADFIAFINGSELVIHNAPFDVGFLNMEFGKIGMEKLDSYCDGIMDSLKFAKEIRPGQRNSLDALCRAFDVDNSTRSLHGALLDAQLLGEVYIQMTRGQEAFTINFEEDSSKAALQSVNHADLIVTQPALDEVEAHNRYLRSINRTDGW